MEKLRPSASDYTTEELIALAERESARIKEILDQDDEDERQREAWWKEFNEWRVREGMQPISWRYPDEITSGDSQ